MRANEFYANAENGVIRIPEAYRNSKRFKVVVVEEEGSSVRDALFPPAMNIKGFKFNREEANARRKSDLLLPPTMSTKGWQFSREEANERWANNRGQIADCEPFSKGIILATGSRPMACKDRGRVWHD